MPGGLIKRSVSLAGHRTSIALEPEFWDALREAARSGGQSLAGLVATVDAARDPGTPLASALRVHALRLAARRPLAADHPVGDPGTQVRREIADR